MDPPLDESKSFQERSAALTTYAICGFSSVGTLMMFIGVWRTVNAGSDTTRVATAIPRVYMNTNIACFITACVAGEIFLLRVPTKNLYGTDMLNAV